VLLDHANRLRRQGLTREQAIIEAGRDRLRPILMTASTTVIGLLPLAIRGTQVAGLFYYPLARTVMGGLVSSAILTLLFLPVLTLGIEGFAGWLRHLWQASTPRRAASPAAAGREL
jgi:HAE1 family hydrophobic/amphiphilic exporter-1